MDETNGVIIRAENSNGRSPWSSFDAVCVAMFSGTAEYMRRADRIRAEFERVGLKGVTEVWSSRSPYDSVLEHALRLSPGCYGAYVPATLKHQQMVRLAYSVGAKRGLFLENDIRFLKNVSALYDGLSSVPTDADVALLDWIVPGRGGEASLAELRSQPDGPWLRFTKPLFHAGGYILGRRGMEAYLRHLERPADGKTIFDVCDRFWGTIASEGLNCYCSHPCLCVQGDGDGITRLGPEWKRYSLFGIQRSDYGD